MNETKIGRINELYKKQKSVGLNEEEKKEQALLRREYIDSVKNNFKSTMNTVKIQDENGNIKSLKR